MEHSDQTTSVDQQSQSTLDEIRERVFQDEDEDEDEDEDDVEENAASGGEDENPRKITVEISVNPWLERFGIDPAELSPPSEDNDGETQLGSFSGPEMLPQEIRDLPRRLPESERPDPPTGLKSSRPTVCSQCGASRDVFRRPLEKGSIEDPDPTPCDAEESENCTCCGCPECGSSSIDHRMTKTPAYRCQNPNCLAEFPRSDINLLNADDDDWEFLYWECNHCGEPTLAPFDGIPDRYIWAAENSSGVG